MTGSLFVHLSVVGPTVFSFTAFRFGIEHSLCSFNLFSYCKLQYEEIARIIDSREELGSVILRNTSADDSVLEILADSLINSHTLKVSFVFSVIQ